MTASKKLLLSYPIIQYSQPTKDNQVSKNEGNKALSLASLTNAQTSSTTNLNWNSLQSMIRSLLYSLIPGLAEGDNADNGDNVRLVPTQSAPPSAAIMVDLQDLQSADNQSAQPTTVTTQPETVATQPATVTTEPTTVTTQPNTDTENAEEIEIVEDGKGGWGDPHYDVTGSNGERFQFDHKGQDGHQYHLFSGDNISIAGTYQPGHDPNLPQIIGDATINVGSDQIEHANNGAITLNGAEIEDGTHQLGDGSTLEKNGSNLTLTAADGSGVVDITSNMDGLRIDPSGAFSGLDGIIGKAIALGEPLSQEECDAFEV